MRSSCRGGAVPECLADFSDTIWINTTSAKGNSRLSSRRYLRLNVSEFRAAG